MALEATHLCFANELKDRFCVTNKNTYFTGAIYPDSRYLTQTKRTLTHPKDYLSWDLDRMDDFRKGWFTHLLCDKLHGEILKEWFPDIFVGDTVPRGEVWMRHTALKILRDIDDVKKFDIVDVLPCLDVVGNPNGENMERMKQYNRIIQKLYAHPATVNVESGFQFWVQLGIGNELALKIIQQAEVFSRDRQLLLNLERVFTEMVFRTKRLPQMTKTTIASDTQKDTWRGFSSDSPSCKVSASSWQRPPFPNEIRHFPIAEKWRRKVRGYSESR